MESISIEMWTAITKSTQFLVVSGISFAIPLIIYLLVGAFRRGRDSSGRKVTKPMLAYTNAWIPVIIYTILGALVYYFLIVNPIWLKIFQN